MSPIICLKKIIPVLVLAILVSSVASPALATPSSKAQPTIVPHGSASPTISPLPVVDNGTINITPDVSPFPGHGKIGNLRMPPSIVKNLTKKIKNQVDDIRLKQARTIAEGRINLIIGQLQLYEKWVSNSGLGNDQKSDIGAIVDSNIAWFRQQVEDLGAAGDLAAVKVLADQADQQAAALKVSIKNEAGLMACDAMDGRIITARNASAGIADKISALKAGGDNTAVAEPNLADYNVHVDAAVRYSLAARTAFEGITSAENTDNGFSEGYRQIELANREMTRAYADLKSVYLWYLQAIRAK